MKGKSTEAFTHGVDSSVLSCVFFKQFHHATFAEKCWMTAGIISAALAGLCIPFIVIFFGNLAEKFIGYDVHSALTVWRSRGERKETIPTGRRWFNVANNTLSNESLIDATIDIAVYTVALGSAQLILGAFFVAALNYSAQKQMLRTRLQYLNAILRQEISWFDFNPAHEVTSNTIKLVNNMYEGLAEKLGMLVYMAVVAFASFTTAFVYGWLLTITLLTVLPIILIIHYIALKIGNSIKNSYRKAYLKSERLASDSLLNIRAVAAYQGYKNESKLYNQCLKRNELTSFRLCIFWGFVGGILWFCLYFTYSVAFYFGVTLAVNKNVSEYTPTTLIIILFNVQLGLMNLLQIPTYLRIIFAAKQSAEKVFSVIERKPIIDISPRLGKIPSNFLGSVTFNNVHFKYVKNPYIEVLRGVSFHVKPGKTVALVGSSGSGKSTCLSLISRLYDVNYGMVLLDGTNVRQLNVNWLRDNVGFVQQHTVLFGATIADAINCGIAESAQNDVTDVAKIVGIHNIIQQMPKKYATPLTNDLTEEVKQRLALARALFRQPSLLLLDNSFSCLSPNSEAEVLTAIKSRAQMTVIVVSSRLSTLKIVDKIIHLVSGIVVEEDSYSHLMERKQWLYDVVRRSTTVICDADDTIDEFEPMPNEYIGQESNRNSLRQPCRVGSELNYENQFFKQSAISVSTLSSSSLDNIKTRFTDIQAKRLPWQHILRMNIREWPLLLTGCVAAVLCGSSLPVYAVLFGECLEVISVNPDKNVNDKLDFYSKMFIAAGLLSGTALMIQAYTIAVSDSKLTKRLRQKTFDSMLRQEMAWFDTEGNDLDSLLYLLRVEAANVQQASSRNLMAVVQLTAVVMMGALLSLYYNLQLGTVVLVSSPLLLAALMFQARTTSYRPFEELQSDTATSWSEAVKAIHVVTALQLQSLVYSSAAAEMARAHEVVVSRLRWSRPCFRGIALAAPALAFTATAIIGARLVLSGQVTTDSVFKVLECMLLGVVLASQLVSLAPDVRRGELAGGRIAALVQRRPLIYSPTVELPAKWRTRGNIRFYRVGFTHPTRPELPRLRDFTLQLREGTSVGLVGAPGCGKTVPVTLLLRFYNPTAGTLLLDARDIAVASLRAVRSQMALVDGDAIFFRRSVADNIAYGSLNGDSHMDDIENAAKEAGAHDFITALPEGYHTVLDESVELRPSEKVRLSLARALIRDPPILLMENLQEVENEDAARLVEAAVSRALCGRTCLLVGRSPHSAVRCAATLCVMRAGAVVEEGPLDALAARPTLFHRLCCADAIASAARRDTTQ